MSEQLFAFLTSLSHEDRVDYFNKTHKVFELTYPYVNADGEVISQEFRTILARNVTQARAIGGMVAKNLNWRTNGWNGYVGVKEVR